MNLVDIINRFNDKFGTTWKVYTQGYLYKCMDANGHSMSGEHNALCEHFSRLLDQ